MHERLPERTFKLIFCMRHEGAVLGEILAIVSQSLVQDLYIGT